MDTPAAVVVGRLATDDMDTGASGLPERRVKNRRAVGRSVTWSTAM